MPNPLSPTDHSDATSSTGVLHAPIWPETLRPIFRRIARSVIIHPLTRARHRRALHAAIEPFQLPSTLAALVVRVVRGTRLWRSEQLDLARELAAHFASGAESGKSESDLAADFGDERSAARLIRRSKKRNRPPAWRFAVRVFQAIALALILTLLSYGVLAYRYFLGRPVLSRNALKEFNTAVAAIPESDRAWPLYIQSIHAIGAQPEFEYATGFAYPTTPDDKDFAVVKQWLVSRPDAIASILRAADKPHLGAFYSTVGDQAYMDALSAVQGRDPIKLEPQPENPLATGILLVPLGQLRRAAQLLIADAAIGVEAREADRVVRDLIGTLQIAQHAREDRLHISELVGIAIVDRTLRALTLYLRDYPELFTDDQLRSLQSAIASYADRPLLFDLTPDRTMYLDLVQRFYTDDGNGNGHPIVGDLGDIYRDFGFPQPSTAERWLGPVNSIKLPSRAHAVELIDRLTREADADQHLPLWRIKERTSRTAYRDLATTLLYPVAPIFSSLTGQTEPYFGSIITRDLFEARRDAALTAIALPRFRLAHGHFPSALDQLVPAFVDRLPVDPFTGQPMKLVHRGDGSSAELILYSVGPDLQDNHAAPIVFSGRPFDDMPANPGENTAALTEWLTGRVPSHAQPAGPCPQGDWILFDSRPASTKPDSARTDAPRQ